MGIRFPGPQSASSDANTLDDYEEGEWTPEVRFGGGTTGITYGNRVGRYTKVGRLVTVYGGFNLTNKGSSTGTFQIFGLPFNCLDAGGYSDPVVSFGYIDSINLGSNLPIGLVARGTSVIEPRKSNGSGSLTQMTNADLTNSSAFIVSATYYVA
jgi:hypothetical protein